MTISELESARLQLSRETRLTDPELTRSLHQVARVAATTLNVDRVSIWLIVGDWKEMHCSLLFDRRTEQFTVGDRLSLAEFPKYSQALRERRVIAAEDARADERTAELSPYFAAHGVGALLDCPVYENGDIVAVVCHEHVGGKRPWSKRDSDFAVSVAELLSTITAQAARLAFELDLRRAREALTQATVMDRLGQMAAEVAHDFNNLLTGIGLSLGVVADALPPAGPTTSVAHAAARDAQSLVAQGAQLVRQLLTFARQGAYTGPPTEVTRALQDCLPRLQRLLGPDTTLTVNLEPQSSPVRMDPALFEQILTNVIVNARHAMPGGGEVRLTSKREGTRLVLSVRDNGVGMSAEVSQRVFEPFFTTKGEGGSGLGLAIVFGAVRGIGGEVRVESAPGRGSTFTFHFPIDSGSST